MYKQKQITTESVINITVCGTCKRKIDDVDKFCKHCGAQIY